MSASASAQQQSSSDNLAGSNLPQSTSNFSIAEHNDQRFTHALLNALRDEPNKEPAVTRYAWLILIRSFSPDRWNFVDQYLAESNKKPDIALENFVRSADGFFFVPQVFVEYKSTNAAMSSADPIEQLRKSIISEIGPRYRSRGFLIGISASIWYIYDYHILESAEGLVCDISNFFADYPGHDENTQPRPRANQQVEQDNRSFTLNISNPADRIILLDALKWIGEGRIARNLSVLNPQARGLTHSITTGNIRNIKFLEERELEALLIQDGVDVMDLDEDASSAEESVESIGTGIRRAHQLLARLSENIPIQPVGSGGGEEEDFEESQRVEDVGDDESGSEYLPDTDV